jgi:NAD(P)-dependent dehydrogenase (short-subunit alcohol dehydrogenase family)
MNLLTNGFVDNCGRLFGRLSNSKLKPLAEDEFRMNFSIVVNNAGYFPNRPIEELDLSAWRNDDYESRLALLEREMLLASDEKEEVRPLCRHTVNTNSAATLAET